MAFQPRDAGLVFLFFATNQRFPNVGNGERGGGIWMSGSAPGVPPISTTGNTFSLFPEGNGYFLNTTLKRLRDFPRANK